MSTDQQDSAQNAPQTTDVAFATYNTALLRVAMMRDSVALSNSANWRTCLSAIAKYQFSLHEKNGDELLSPSALYNAAERMWNERLTGKQRTARRDFVNRVCNAYKVNATTDMDVWEDALDYYNMRQRQLTLRLPESE